LTEAISNLDRLSKDMPLYVLSTDHGRLRGKGIIKGKRLIGITVDPWGGVRTERGGPIRDRITPENDLERIITSETVQGIFRSKSNGEADAPYDSGRAELRGAVFTGIKGALK